MEKENDAMTKIMSPSITTITEGQNAKFVELLMAALRKSGLSAELTQRVLESRGATLANEFVAAVRSRVQELSEVIYHSTSVCFDTPEQILTFIGRKQFIDMDVIKTMPKPIDQKPNVGFFHLGHFVTNDELEAEYALRGLSPVDPYSLASINKEDPQFGEYHPNCTHWRDTSGKWCSSSFRHWGNERLIRIVHGGRGWESDWWFGGIKKQ